MTTITNYPNTLTNSFLEIQRDLIKVPHLEFLRKEGLTLLQRDGLPTNKSEEYKFTAATKKIESNIKRYSNAVPSKALDQKKVSQHLIPGLDAHVVVVNNGIFDQSLSSIDPTGISISQFENLPTEKLDEKVGRIAAADKDPFISLNQLFFQEGLWMEINSNTVLQKPVLILQFVHPSLEGETVHPRSYIQVGKNAKATFIETVISLDDSPYLLNGVTEINISENSQVEFYRLQDENKEAIEVNNTHVDVARDASFSSAVISLQGQMIRNNLSINLIASNSLGNMYGLYLLNGRTHVDNHTNVDHTKPHAESNELYKGILADHSRGVFNGKIFVRQDAQKTNAFQQNNNILLSEDAVVNTKPQLEIWADDVKCSHGCTTGQLDDEALFYLRSRGISKESSRGMLLYAFAGEVLEKINNEAFRDYCIGLVQQRLGSNYV
jgi:Fe-S cluster assembly protein SufD